MVCPLCNGVIEHRDIKVSKKVNADFPNESTEIIENSEDNIEDITEDSMDLYHSRSIMYPDVEPAMKRLKFIIKLFVFLSVIVECILVLINYLTYNGVKWSVICGGALFYLCFTLIYTFQRNTGHRKKMIAQMIGAMILVYVIDYVLGYHGWSVNYAIPAGIILLDVAVLVLMLVNSSNWQSYIMVQFVMLLISIVFIILVAVDVVKNPILTIVAVSITVILLVGTVLFGDKKAMSEITKRFRV